MTRPLRRAVDIDLTRPTGDPISTGQLARYVGFSVQTIRRDIEAGELRGYRHGRAGEWRITWAEARRYCLTLGIISEGEAPVSSGGLRPDT